jgi:hypothetical protein
MSTPQKRESVKNRLIETLGKISEFDVEELIRRRLGEDFDFEPARPQIEASLKLFRELAQIDIGSVPYTLLGLMHTQVSNVLNLFEEMKAFSPTRDPHVAGQRRDGIIKGLERFSHQCSANC